MKILVCGGRDFNKEDIVFDWLDNVAEVATSMQEPITHVIHGLATGADTLAGIWARSRGIQEVSCPANWRKHGKRAGALRNLAMLELLDPKSDQTICFPGGAGTKMMKEMSINAGVHTSTVLVP